MAKRFFGHCTPDLLSVEYSTSNVEYSTLLQDISQNITINGYAGMRIGPSGNCNDNTLE